MTVPKWSKSNADGGERGEICGEIVLSLRVMKKLLLLTVLVLSVGLSSMVFHVGSDWADSDFVSQQIPFILETKRMLASGAPWWSWNTFAGDNFVGAYSFYTLTSPFVWLVCLFPAGQVLWGLLIALYLKAMCTAAFSFLYFRRMGFGRPESTLGGLLYCFSSFFICNLYYFHFCEPIMVFPLLLMALEGMIRGRSGGVLWLAGAVALVVWVNFYFALPSLLLGALYFFFRSYGLGRLTLRSTLQAAGAVAWGIALAAVVLLPAALHNVGGARAGLGHVSLGRFPLVFNALERICALILPGVSEVRHDGLAILPNAWGSTQGFVTVFGCFCSAVYCIRRRNWLSRLLIVLVVMYVTPLNALFSGLTQPLYTRWLYGLNLLMILTVLSVMKEGMRVSLPDFWRYAGVCVAVIAVGVAGALYRDYKMMIPNVVSAKMVTSLALFAVNAAALYVVVKRRRVATAVRAVCVCGALNLCATVVLYTYRGDDEGRWVSETVFAGDFDGREPRVTHRIDVLSPMRNYGLYRNYPGVFFFHSSMNRGMHRAYATVVDDITQPEAFCSRHRDSFASLMAVKEVVASRDGARIGAPYEWPLTKRRSAGQYAVWENPNYVPFGCVYDSYVTESELQAAVDSAGTGADVALMMLGSMVVRDDDAPAFGRLLRRGTMTGTLRLDSVARERRREAVSGFEGTSRGFTCRTDFKQPKAVFFSVVADPGFKVTIDGRPAHIYQANLGMMALMVPAGPHAIRFDYLPPGLIPGAAISLAALLSLLAAACFRRRSENRCFAA